MEDDICKFRRSRSVSLIRWLWAYLDGMYSSLLAYLPGLSMIILTRTEGR